MEVKTYFSADINSILLVGGNVLAVRIFVLLRKAKINQVKQVLFDSAAHHEVG